MLNASKASCSSPCARRQQAGMSIVELMVGVALGLFVVAAAALMVSSQLSDNRRLLLETQLQQDLRASADIITRELRRASYDATSVSRVWHPTQATAPTQSAFGALTPSSGEDLTELQFKYRRRSGDEGPYGFKVEDYALKSMIGGQWQTLTDRNVMKVTSFQVDLTTPATYPLPCPKLCADGTQDCWPELQTRVATVTITGQSAVDPNTTRTLTTSVRLRNDFTQFNGAELCPA